MRVTIIQGSNLVLITEICVNMNKKVGQRRYLVKTGFTVYTIN